MRLVHLKRATHFLLHIRHTPNSSVGAYRGAKQLVVVTTAAMFSGPRSVTFALIASRSVTSSSPLSRSSTTTGCKPGWGALHVGVWGTAATCDVWTLKGEPAPAELFSF